MQEPEALRTVANDCVHCGFCLPACPTYQLWGEEMDSPRGRIHLVSQLLDGAELTDAAAEHFDRCLGCMACMTACPSGVQYDQLIEAARVWTEKAHSGTTPSTPSTPPVPSAPPVPSIPPAESAPLTPSAPSGNSTPPTPSALSDNSAPSAPSASSGNSTPPAPSALSDNSTLSAPSASSGKPAPSALADKSDLSDISYMHREGSAAPGMGRRPVRDRAARAAIFALFPYPRRLRAALGPLRLAQRTGLDRRIAASELPGRVSPALGAALRLAPPPARSVRLPERVAALGARRAVVGMLTGCVQSVFFPGVNAATARVLAMEGCEVVIPRGQGCCGALSLHSGREAEAVSFAERTIAAFERAGVDAVVVNSAGCGSAMKEYDRLLGGPSPLSGKVRDFSEFLAELGPVAERHPVRMTAAYHDACHLGHAQRITRQPRDLLRAIPELELVELADAGNCCGSAGVYNLLQPEAAAELGRRKGDAVQASGAPVLISPNPGCSLQIASVLAARGQHISVMHVAEVLDASMRGGGSGRGTEPDPPPRA